MEFNSIYKNGKPDYFFITIDSKKGERAFIQPYFIVKIGRASCRERV